jgi:hypothetical protein
MLLFVKKINGSINRGQELLYQKSPKTSIFTDESRSNLPSAIGWILFSGKVYQTASEFPEFSSHVSVLFKKRPDVSR